MKIIVSLSRLLIALAALGAILLSTASGQAAPEALQYYSRDNFNTVAYNNNDGPVNWGGNWTELNDNGLAGSGNVQITTGGELRIDNQDGDGVAEGIYRLITNRPGATQVTLYFDYRTSNTLEATDQFRIGVSTNNCTAVTTLETLADDSQGGRVYNITPYMAANLVVCLQVNNNTSYTAADEYIYFKAIQVTYYIPSNHAQNYVVRTVQTYYIPVPEDLLNTINTTIYPRSGGGACTDRGISNPSLPIETYLSIAIVSNDTVIYYDHWEDGFETEVNRPSQVTSEVWGDNNMANGAPPGFTTDVLQAGDIIILSNPVMPATRQTVIDYDGGDKIASTDPIAVTHIGWNSGSGTLMALAQEVLDTSIWGTRYDVPVGQTTDAARQVFEYTGMVVMAMQDNTIVSLNGAQVAILNQGQGYLINGGLNAGNYVTSSAPVQAQLYTGDICDNFESRSFTLYPTNLWSNNYYNPVSAQTSGTDATPSTAVFLFNPGAAQITVNWSTSAGPQTPVTVASRGTTRVVIPTGVGARFYTPGGETFFAVGAVDANCTASADCSAYDWGYSLIPANQLTKQALVGFGMGQDPTKPITENSGPVWVTAALPPGKTGTAPYDVCVDYNGDGVGSLTDINGRHYDLLLSLSELQSAHVYDSDGDQTGMLLYICGDDDGDARIAVAWGEDPAVATAGAPGLDVGTTVPPLPDFVAVKNARLTNDLQDNGLFDVGDTFAYDILIKNSGALPIPSGVITATDIVPTYTIYVPNSTTFDNSITITGIPDDAGLPPYTAFPLDGAGYTVNEVLPIEGVFTITFQVRINPTLPEAVRVQNKARVSGLDLHYDPNVEIIVQPPDENARIGDFVWLDLDGDGVQDTGEPGIVGVTLELRDGVCVPGVTCLTDITDANGEYGFPNLGMGLDYTVIVLSGTLPSGLTQTGDPDQPGVTCTLCDGQQTINLNTGNTPYLNADFGYQGTGSIGDRIWNDMDGDGVQDTGEGGISGVVVWLDLDGDGNRDTNEPYATTDANGIYTISGLPAGTYSVRVDPTTLPAGASQTGDPDQPGIPCTTCDGRTSVTLTTGQHVVTADFGYRFAALSISKISSAGGTTTPGATIDYTINIVNNTASPHTGIAVTDAVPSGTTFVSGSVTGYQQFEYRDNFNTGGGYSQSAGLSSWSGQSWAETGDDNSPTGGTIQIVNNELRLRNAAGDSIARTIPGNLTGQTVTLEIDYREGSTLEAGDWFYVEMWNGTGWTAVIQLENDFGNPAAQIRDISPYARNGDTQIRIRSTYNGEGGTNEDVFVDYVRVYYTANIVGGAIHSPPNLLIASDNFSLNAGQSMQITYRVTVNNPPPAGLPSINNTASVVSTQQSTPQYSSTQDNLPPANLGDWVWYDLNNNGLQDVGETGISGVVVHLYKDLDGDGVAEPGGHDGAFLDSTATDSSGNYQFASIPADHYFLVFEFPTGYSYATANVGGNDNIDSDAGAGGATTVFLLTSNETNNSFDAGLRSTLDYGDLPSGYHVTLLSENGARHVVGTLRLGSGTTSVEGDGQPDANAARDSIDDGVTRQPGLNGASNGGGWTVGAVEAGQGGSLNITISGGSGVPQVFVDFGNGSGGGTNTLTEVTLRDSSGTALITPLAAGTYRVYFDIPGGTFGAPIQPVAMRVRLSSSGGLLATGPASDGEVEDYIFKFGPTSIGLVNFSARSSAPFTLWLVLLVAVAALVMTGIFWRLSRRRVQ